MEEKNKLQKGAYPNIGPLGRAFGTNDSSPGLKVSLTLFRSVQWADYAHHITSYPPPTLC